MLKDTIKHVIFIFLHTFIDNSAYALYSGDTIECYRRLASLFHIGTRLYRHPVITLLGMIEVFILTTDVLIGIYPFVPPSQ